jgi:predicted glycogen debranching enzyme
MIDEDLLTFSPPTSGQLDLEWLETFGNGGYAAMSVSGAQSRGYNGLLVAPVGAHGERINLITRLDELIRCDGQHWDLAVRKFDGAIHPNGAVLLESADFRHLPTFRFRLGTSLLERRYVASDTDPSTLLIEYVWRGTSSAELLLTPFLAYRGYHSRRSGGDAPLTDGKHEPSGVISFPDPSSGLTSFLCTPGGQWTPHPAWYRRFFLAREAERGLEPFEDLFTPGYASLSLAPNQPLVVGLSTTKLDPSSFSETFSRVASSRPKVDPALDKLTTLEQVLRRAAGQFVLNGESIIAGFPWFTDWGRDTMIALPGLTLVTGRHDLARGILGAYRRSIRDGLIPNRFPDGVHEPEYNSVDATLWYFVAAYRYVLASNDTAFAKDLLLPSFDEILAAFRVGTRYGIQATADGLLKAGAPGVQLTWMDAKIGNEVVTPRMGLAVEINALWYNALRIAHLFHTQFGSPHLALEYEKAATAAFQSFERTFRHPTGRGLIDCITDGLPDPAVRPNQLFAVSLPFTVVSAEIGATIVQIVTENLLTPVGIRTLAPHDPQFRPRYSGGPAERDRSYHQGTVWPWLSGPYVSALIRVHGESGRAAAREHLSEFAAHLCDAGIGTISEIYDATPPYSAHGCFAQAWSVAEILRAIDEVRAGQSPREGYGI